MLAGVPERRAAGGVTCWLLNVVNKNDRAERGEAAGGVLGSGCAGESTRGATVAATPRPCVACVGRSRVLRWALCERAVCGAECGGARGGKCKPEDLCVFLGLQKGRRM